jgi:hypothetical protein
MDVLVDKPITFLNEAGVDGRLEAATSSYSEYSE